MRRLKGLLTLSVLLVCLLAIQPGAGLAQSSDMICAEPIVVRVSEDYRPYSIRNDRGIAEGIDVTFLTNVLDAVGCDYQIVFMPWKRAVHQLSNGDVDLMPFASITDERRQFAYFSKPYRNEVAGMIIRREDIGKYPISRLDDIIGHQMRLGHTEGAYRGEMFKQFLSQPEAQDLVFNVNLTSHGIQMLTNHRIDALVEVPTAAMAQAELMGLSDALVAHPLVLLSEPVHFMFSKLTVSPMLVDKINVEIDKAMQTDEYRALYGAEALSESSGS